MYCVYIVHFPSLYRVSPEYETYFVIRLHYFDEIRKVNMYLGPKCAGRQDDESGRMESVLKK